VAAEVDERSRRVIRADSDVAGSGIFKKSKSRQDNGNRRGGEVLGSGKLTILQINDTHGYLEEHQEMFWDAGKVRHKKLGGYAKIAGYFKQVRLERGADAVIALDNGDTLHGTFPAVNSKGEAFIKPLNRLGLDAWTIHWDIIYGPEQLKVLTGKLDYPLLAVNGYREETNESAFQPSLVVKRGGIKVGIIGIAAYIIDKAFPKRVSTGLRFTLGKDELPAQIHHLRETEGVDLIVVLSHLGFAQDYKLATEVDGIDILLSGHTHNRMYQPAVINGATIIQSGCHASFVGRLDVEVTDGKISGVSHELVELNDNVESDAEMAAIVEEIYAPHREMLAEIVGETATHLNRYTTLESTMDNFLLDAIAAAADTEIAFSNGWRYGAPISAGKVTVNDLWNIIPSNPPVSIVEMTGAEIREMMEESLERTFSSDAYQQMGGYVKRCRGLNVYCKIENPAGARIQEFFAEGERLENERTYTAAFVTEQGVPKKYGRNRRDLEIKAIDALRNHLKKHRSITADLHGAVVAV
ncbi:MAG: 5'-nucleotidase C-terminal domain-containing protein, partial [Candidatus Thermoplasmatota archaeon]